MTKRLSWAVRLEQAEKRGKFTQKDKELAGNFMTCAVAERHSYPKNWYDKTDEEYGLGLDFTSAVSEGGDIPEAKRIYQLIQELP